MAPDFEDALITKANIESELSDCLDKDVTDFEISNLVKFTTF